eukprot:m.13160 g.13160  ORF g.13160 m.13160 type:complete len:229 (-) comp4622_c0_seq2:117-803(-)
MPGQKAKRRKTESEAGPAVTNDSAPPIDEVLSQLPEPVGLEDNVPRPNPKLVAQAIKAASNSGYEGTANKKPVAQRVGRVAPGLYLVESLLDKRIYNHYKLGPIQQYKVKWVGYPESECTWEPEWGIPDVFKQAYNQGTPMPEVNYNDEGWEEEAKDEVVPGAVLFRCSRPRCFVVEGFPREFEACGGCAAAEGGASGGTLSWARYCSRKCQRKDWARHRGECSASTL